MFVAALAVAVVPVVLFGGSVDTWVYRALALLIVACPCSLVISIPVAVVSAVGRAARDGVLVKGGQALEDLARVRTVAIDKTGTLTGGRRCSATSARSTAAEAEMLALVAAVERGSEHPLAQALVQAARDRGLAVGAADGFEALPGRGSSPCRRARVVGGRAAACERPPRGHARGRAVARARGETAMVLGEGDRALAVFGLADQPRPEAADRCATAARPASAGRHAHRRRRAGRARSRVSAPGVDAVPRRAAAGGQARRRRGAAAERGPVAMVGDGVNDAPRSAAPTSASRWAPPAPAPRFETADIALMSDDLSRLPHAVRGARQAARVCART